MTEKIVKLTIPACTPGPFHIASAKGGIIQTCPSTGGQLRMQLADGNYIKVVNCGGLSYWGEFTVKDGKVTQETDWRYSAPA